MNPQEQATLIGPWKMRKLSVGTGNGNDAFVIDAPDPDYDAEYPDSHRGLAKIRDWVTDDGRQELAERVATLMAAAPELLEALESIENDCGCIPAGLWEKCNKAIAKAKGETSGQ